MGITEDLIIRFFNKQCTESEADAVLMFFKQHPEALDKYLAEHEWNQPVPEDLAAGISPMVWQNIAREKSRGRRILMWAGRIAAAVCIAGIATAGYRYMQKETPVKREMAAAATATQLQQTMQNNADTVMHFVLPDGSVTGLSPGASITYAPDYNRNTRTLHLKGEATFKVAKDKTRPFIVFNNGISVTALGTFFSVKENTSTNNTEVRLYEGKVKVEKLKKDAQLSFTSLTPGMRAVYNARTTVMRVEVFQKNMERMVLATAAPVGNASPAAQKPPALNSSFMFNNQPMKDVFRTLEVLYDVQIKYRPQDIENLNFIGRFDRNDSVEHILTAICLINNIQISTTDHKTFSIRNIP